jgi:hypothetical protein
MLERQHEFSFGAHAMKRTRIYEIGGITEVWVSI